MTTGSSPRFMDSLYFINEYGNWHLKPGAPAHVVKEFTEFIEAAKQMEQPQA